MEGQVIAGTPLSDNGATTRISAAGRVMLREVTGLYFDAAMVKTLRWATGSALKGTRYQLYKQMKKDPVIRIGLAARKAPILAQDWRIEGPDERTNKFVAQAIKPVWTKLLRSSLTALEYGTRIHEKIFESRTIKIQLKGRRNDVMRNAWVPKRLKPIHPLDATPVQKSLKNGTIAGPVEAWQCTAADGVSRIDVPLEKLLVICHEDENDIGIGESELENIEECWLEGAVVQKLYGRYMENRAIPPYKARGPFANREDPEHPGQYIAGQEVLLRVTENLRIGHGVALPFEVDQASGSQMWDIEEMSISERGDLFSDYLERNDALKLRGLLFPDKVLIQGRSGGSQAETQTMTETFYLVEDLHLKEVQEQLNTGLIAPIQELNDLEPTARLEIDRLRPSARTSLLRNILALVGESVNERKGKKFKGADAIDILKTLRYLGIPALSEDEIEEMVKDEGTGDPTKKQAPPMPGPSMPSEPLPNASDPLDDATNAV